MGAHTKRAASVVLAVVLSGTPALLAACAMLCVPAASHASEGAVCCVAERETPPADHAHHGTPAGNPGSRVAPDVAVQVASTDGSCCPDGQSAAVAAVASSRVDTGLLVAQPVAAITLDVAPPSLNTATAGRLHSPPRSPARTPLVLRV